MKIKWVEVKNFRSITTTSFSLASGVNALVGGNESGKSNVLLALERFLNCDDFIPDDRYQLTDLETEITVEFNEFTEDEYEVLTRLYNGVRIADLKIKRVKDEYSLVGPTIPNELSHNLDEDSGSNGNEQEQQSHDIFKEDILPLIPDAISINTVEDLIIGNPILTSELFWEDAEFDKVENANKKYLRTIRSLLEVGDITKEDILEPDIAKRVPKLERAAAKISRLLDESWKQEDVKLRMSSDVNNLLIEFRDGRNIAPEDFNNPTKWIWTLPQNRSFGFRWYVTFYARYLAQMKNDNSAVFLVDDVGAPLNKAAQADLLNEFRKLSEDNSTQIVYVTHSKDMIEWDMRNSIYCVTKQGGTGTEVVQYWWERFSKNELPAPLDELGVTWLNDFLKNENLIVEGITDALVLNSLAQLFIEHIPSDPFKGYKLIQGGGADPSIEMAMLCKAHGRKLLLIFDSDEKGLRSMTKATDGDHSLAACDLASLANSNTVKILTIEDLIPREIFKACLNEIGQEKFPNQWEKINRLYNVESLGIIDVAKKRIVNMGIPEAEVNEFIKIYKYDIIQCSLKLITLESYTTEHKEAVIRLLNNINSNLG